MPQRNLLLQRLSGLKNDRETLRVMMFSISTPSTKEIDYLLALPVAAILKVMSCPPISGSLKEGLGILNIGSQTITILDLYQKFAPHSAATEHRTRVQDYPFLILLKTITGEPCGIPVGEPPVLLDIPLNTVRPLPPSYRQVNDLNFASHLAIIPQDEGQEPLKVFLLGMDSILSIEN
jgi:chemotaxis signal transduction protein